MIDSNMLICNRDRWPLADGRHLPASVDGHLSLACSISATQPYICLLYSLNICATVKKGTSCPPSPVRVRRTPRFSRVKYKKIT